MSTGHASQYFTLADEERGFIDTRKALAAYTVAELAREYFECQRDCFGFNIFCNNARKYFNLIVDELRTRGITHLPNIFGPIEVRPWQSRNLGQSPAVVPDRQG